MSWCVALASVAGSSHEAAGRSCDDVSACRLFQAYEGAFLLLVASDGAGFASHGGLGAARAVEVVVAEAERFSFGPEAPTERDVARWLDVVSATLAHESELSGLRAMDMACTLVVVVSDDKGTVVGRVGDGAAVVRRRGTRDWSVPVPPQHGEFANETSFVTSTRVRDLLDVERVPASDGIVVLTDGLEGVVLDGRGEPHAPFFDMIAIPVENLHSSAPCHADDVVDRALSSDLSAYLRSPSVRTRTDDDVTLVVASRRVVA